MSSSRILVAYLLVLCVGYINCQVISFGKCPDVKVKKDFDQAQYLGKWFEIARFYASFEKDSSCVSANYSLKDNGHILVNNSGYFPDKGYSSAIGDAVADKKEPAKLKVKFSWWQPRGPYWVLDTDYINYTLVHSCTSYIFGLFNMQFNWILARDSTLPDEMLSTLKQQFTDAGIDVEKFEYVNQINCTRHD